MHEAYLKETSPAAKEAIGQILINSRMSAMGHRPLCQDTGSENKSKFVNLNPANNVEDWVVKTVSELGSGWCPPGIIGLGIGGNPEKSMLMAKESLMAHIDIHKIIERGPQNTDEELRLGIYQRVNNLGIGAQGLGGKTTVLDVKLKTYPTHAASMPVALIPNCAATRHISFELDGTASAQLPLPDLSIWPKIELGETDAVKLNIENLTKENISKLKLGQTILLSGKILTARDAAHKKILEHGEILGAYGVDFTNRLVYYVGPVSATGDEILTQTSNT